MRAQKINSVKDALGATRQINLTPFVLEKRILEMSVSIASKAILSLDCRMPSETTRAPKPRVKLTLHLFYKRRHKDAGEVSYARAAKVERMRSFKRKQDNTMKKIGVYAKKAAPVVDSRDMEREMEVQDTQRDNDALVETILARVCADHQSAAPAARRQRGSDARTRMLDAMRPVSA